MFSLIRLYRCDNKKNFKINIKLFQKLFTIMIDFYNTQNKKKCFKINNEKNLSQKKFC